MDKRTATRLYEVRGSVILRPSVSQSSRMRQEGGRSPSEGIFYIARFVDRWEPFTYRFDEFVRHRQYGDFNHGDLWEEYLSEILVENWSITDPETKFSFGTHDHAFPQGRVVQVPGREAKFQVLHGDDIEPFMSVSRETIEHLFDITDIAAWVKDERECCLQADRDAVRAVLQLPPEENWKAV